MKFINLEIGQNNYVQKYVKSKSEFTSTIFTSTSSHRL